MPEQHGGNTAGQKPVLSNVNWLLTFQIYSVIRLKRLAIAVLHWILPFMHLPEVFPSTVQTLLIYICNSWTQTCQMNTNCHWRNQESSNYQGMGRWNCRYPHCCRVEVLWSDWEIDFLSITFHCSDFSSDFWTIYIRFTGLFMHFPEVYVKLFSLDHLLLPVISIFALEYS